MTSKVPLIIHNSDAVGQLSETEPFISFSFFLSCWNIWPRRSQTQQQQQFLNGSSNSRTRAKWVSFLNSSSSGISLLQSWNPTRSTWFTTFSLPRNAKVLYTTSTPASAYDLCQLYPNQGKPSVAMTENQCRIQRSHNEYGTWASKRHAWKRQAYLKHLYHANLWDSTLTFEFTVIERVRCDMVAYVYFSASNMFVEIRRTLRRVCLW